MQKIWQRPDDLATTELLTLGHALATMEKIDAKWVKDSVREIRKNDSNCHGWLFELLACTMFASAEMTVRPMPESFPGYDAEIIFDDGFKLRVSMKNHDMSGHERKFHERAAALRRNILNKLEGQSVTAQVVITGLTYLDELEFISLCEVVGNSREIVEVETIPEIAAIAAVNLLPADGKKFAKGYVSDTFIVLCPHHQNEQKRFTKKVFEAASNFRKNTSRTDDSCNVIMMRLHPSASIDNIEAFASNLLNSSTDNPDIDMIWLYQPSAIRQGDSSMVSHHFRVVISQHYVVSQCHQKKNHPVKINTLIGGISTEPSRLELHSTSGEAPLPITGHYVFQRGDHYFAATKDGDSLLGGVNTPAPGIHAHTVFDLEGGKFAVKGKYHDNEELVII